jgi:glyoxylase-like metal-dependent hydrolase (beta-lactamase superfamily II)
VHDHRNFGTSGGDLRGDIDPWRQIADWRRVISYLERRPEVDRSRFVKQGGEITSGVRYVAAPGHSPSHASILFASGKEQFMHMGDIAHNPVTSLQHPEWTPIFDYDPAEAITSRRAILDRVATDGIMAMGYHFPFPGIGHVVKHDKAYRWEAVHWAW